MKTLMCWSCLAIITLGTVEAGHPGGGKRKLKSKKALIQMTTPRPNTNPLATPRPKGNPFPTPRVKTPIGV